MARQPLARTISIRISYSMLEAVDKYASDQKKDRTEVIRDAIAQHLQYPMDMTNKRLDNLDFKMDAVNSKLDNLDFKMDAINSKLDNLVPSQKVQKKI